MTDPPDTEEGAEAHCAWLHSLSPEERMIVGVPPGQMFGFLVIAYIKHALLHCKMTAGERLEILECLNRTFDPATLAAIEPMSETEIAMVHEARSLDREDDSESMASYRVLTRVTVFDNFVRLNPSILTAIKMNYSVYPPRVTDKTVWQHERLSRDR